MYMYICSVSWYHTSFYFLLTSTKSNDTSVSKQEDSNADASDKASESKVSLEDEGVSDEGSDDSEKDEEELMEMLFTLQKVYDDVCSPSSKASPKIPQTLQDSPPKNSSDKLTSSSLASEDWQESDEEAPPPSNSGHDQSGNVDVFDRLETTRVALEDAMGVDKLLTAYGIVQVCAYTI